MIATHFSLVDQNPMSFQVYEQNLLSSNPENYYMKCRFAKSITEVKNCLERPFAHCIGF
jgi:hypothetical protein